MKKAMALAVLICCFSCISSTQKKESRSTKEESDTDENWRYAISKDEMEGDNVPSEASCKSERTIEFKFPYGKSSFSFYVRNKGNTSDVFLSCTNCQFVSGIGGTKSYQVKFDDEKPISVTVTSPSDGNYKYIFLGFTKTNLTQLKASKKMVIEAEFFQEGSIPLPFNTEGLKWAD